MTLRYSAHLNTLYGAVPWPSRPARAAGDGFGCVELWAPPADQREVLALELDRLALEVACVNTAEGPYADDFGQLGNPAAAAWWREDFRQTLAFARRIRAGAINVLAGGRLAGSSREHQLATAHANLAWALTTLREGDPLLLLEPLNAADRRSPLLRGVDDARALIDRLDRPGSLRLLFDAYHLFQEESDLLAVLRDAEDCIGHIQIADWPGRGRPGTGRIPFPELLDAIERLGYDGWIGLEHFPHPAEEPTVPPAPHRRTAATGGPA
ncbi:MULTISPECIES: TIM barrel protein [Streptacidiphilus]|uniref:TIM barrel protein n=1 Tax=Streptacidiphilus cavernicola TaxID=3342716 RepID=A0ABV6UVP1_9ACTN|nr:TIM barrel protein [Streptacidiphilus jeojiense]